MRITIKVVLLIVAIIAITGTSSAGRNPSTHVWNASDHGSFASVQQLIDSILLVNPSSQTPGVEPTFISSVPLGLDNDALGHVYTGIIPPGPPDGLGPTHGGMFVIMSTGNAGQIIGNPGDLASTAFNDPVVDPFTSDSFKWFIPLTWVPGSSSILEIDTRFMSDEFAPFSGFNDNFKASICNAAGGGCVPIKEYSVDTHFDLGTIVPSGTLFDWSTPLETTSYDVSAAGIGEGTNFFLVFEITDAGPDNDFDSAVLLDRLSFGPGQAEIPEFPTIALPVAAVLGLMFLFSRKRKG